MKEFDLFDLYLERVLNFGYVILFASAFPLAPFLLLLFNIVEIFTSKLKLSVGFRRPLP